MAGLVLVLGAAAAVLMAGCGGGNDNSESAGNAESQNSSAAKPLPPDAPMSKVLRRQFPPPEPQPGSPPGAQAAIEAGRHACKGKTPAQVRDEFLAEAKASGQLNPGQEKMLAEIGHFEKQSDVTPDFVAGQLAAGVYEATLPEQWRISGYQGCVYELARQLEKELPKG